MASQLTQMVYVGTFNASTASMSIIGQVVVTLRPSIAYQIL